MKFKSDIRISYQPNVLSRKLYKKVKTIIAFLHTEADCFQCFIIQISCDAQIVFTLFQPKGYNQRGYIICYYHQGKNCNVDGIFVFSLSVDVIKANKFWYQDIGDDWQQGWL